MQLSMNRLLWVDCLGGLTMGVLVMAYGPTIAYWDNLPLVLIISVGVTNLIYGCFSLNLVIRNERPIILLYILVFANTMWFFVCCTLTTVWWADISMIGIFHLIGEGAYVAFLGCLEWRYREALRTT